MANGKNRKKDSLKRYRQSAKPDPVVPKINLKKGTFIGTDKKQTLLGVITGERGKKVKPHIGRKCPGNQVYNQKLKKCVPQSGPAYEAYRAQRERRSDEKLTVRRLMKGVHGTQR